MPEDLTPDQLANVTGGARFWRRASDLAARVTHAMYLGEQLPEPAKTRPHVEPEHPMIRMFGPRR